MSPPRQGEAGVEVTPREARAHCRLNPKKNRGGGGGALFFLSHLVACAQNGVREPNNLRFQRQIKSVAEGLWRSKQFRHIISLCIDVLLFKVQYT